MKYYKRNDNVYILEGPVTFRDLKIISDQLLGKEQEYEVFRWGGVAMKETITKIIVNTEQKTIEIEYEQKCD
jgi:hypothetical protein